MTIRKTGKIWLGIGTAAAIGVGLPAASPISAQGKPETAQAQSKGGAATQHPAGHGSAASAPAQGGEGGEGGEGDAGLDSRVRFFRDMALVRGHLLVGGELIGLDRWLDALPHFHHPIEELYAAIGARLKVHNVRQFDPALKALAQAVAAKKKEAYEAALKTVEQRMAEVDKALAKFAEPPLEWHTKAFVAVLQAAASEYREAAEDNKIAKPIEYQDSRGFVLQAGKMLEGLTPLMAKKDPKALDEVRDLLSRLAQNWPAPVPPERAVMQPSDVLVMVSRIELAASAFLRK